MVDQIFPRWNRLQQWFELAEAFRTAASSARSTIYAVLGRALLSAVTGEPHFREFLNQLDRWLRQVEGLRRVA